MFVPRQRRDPGARRDAIIGAASALFLEKGYEATTVSDILARAGVSKGGFYHHFATKEDALEAFCVELAESLLEEIEPILKSEVLSPYERLNDMLTTMRQARAETLPDIIGVFGPLFAPENLALYSRINRAIGERIAPAFAQVIAEGAEDGTFMIVGDAETTAEIMFAVGTASYEPLAALLAAAGTPEAEAAAVKAEQRLVAQGFAADRILGLPDGSIRFADPGFVRLLLDAAAALAAR
ncbi:TetR/AcrR family transcriptional regulator [Pelagibacterium montanilacus]|uniref:TetR/AcrR family transcriptional regulator n=1 Tax=Pelagibacterium montanilacus TaxID=2185280 RepID=UPI0013E03289|nr:TetR/AcrR family transcriptional regulator [Pelagibacterium montanilacus]